MFISRNSEEKQELDYGSGDSNENRKQEDEAEGTDQKNKDERVTANTAKIYFLGERKIVSRKKEINA